MHKDRKDDDVGARQKRWLDYLQYHNQKTLRVCYEHKKKKFSRWMDVNEAICPIDHREIIKNERVIEFDCERQQGLRLCNIIHGLLSRLQYPYYIQDHQGRSPHIHVFNLPPDTKFEKTLPHLDKLKFTGQGLCREIGGRYYKNNTTYYATHITEIDNSTPTTKINEVKFPCINLHKT